MLADSIPHWSQCLRDGVQLVIAEDVSDDLTPIELLRHLREIFPGVTHIVSDPALSPFPVLANNPALGINLAVRFADSEIILKTDPECIPLTNLTKQAIDSFNPGHILFCKTLMEREDGSTFCIVPDMFRRPYWFASVFSKTVFVEAGGVEEEFLSGFAAEDDEFGERLARRGISWVFPEDMIVLHRYHDPPSRNLHMSDLHQRNIALMEESRRQSKLVANQGRSWADPKSIMSIFRW
ncbi:MAG: glycosyltransferase [bacterium JZ-2024 1]